MKHYLILIFGILFVWTPMKGIHMNQIEQATFGGGCFWCVEAVYQRVVGVISVKPGYAAGHTQNPTYKEVCSGDTGHAEVARIEFEVEYLRIWLTQRLTWLDSNIPML